MKWMIVIGILLGWSLSPVTHCLWAAQAERVEKELSQGGSQENQEGTPPETERERGYPEERVFDPEKPRPGGKKSP
jgi:hypothetical protein